MSKPGLWQRTGSGMRAAAAVLRSGITNRQRTDVLVAVIQLVRSAAGACRRLQGRQPGRGSERKGSSRGSSTIRPKLCECNLDRLEENQ